MFNDFARKLAALALTVVTSATLIVSAVGPATAHGGNGAVASTTRFMA
ncbi:hypothetical protein Q5H91_02345 [Sphingomonas sp. KR1UV-12]|uniref:Uncharacterized protein n=1 Tax=Sphingomonas aurea TaxID=3063994 RepID=A0ABT9EGY1_9SPHN|nr:hypothetical protein [Sphingomonas sp. KR1UV-12]MDP1026038.1 hypothetical protein [Sphingomonas sp. KR1UV-12]